MDQSGSVMTLLVVSDGRDDSADSLRASNDWADGNYEFAHGSVIIEAMYPTIFIYIHNT